MKMFIFLAFITSAFAETQKLESEVINVDGVLQENEVASDSELEGLKVEIKKQKEEIVLNKAKSKSYQALSESVEELSETTEEYLIEKREAKEKIAEFNAMVKCKSEDHPSKECEKYVRRSRDN
jgi:hypothetical protein